MAVADPEYFAAALRRADPDVCKCPKEGEGEAAAGAGSSSAEDLFKARWVKCT
jgi:hypothetical protein